MLLQLGCSIVGLIALQLCQKNPKITIAVSLICALMVSFITYHWNVDVLVLVMAGLLAVFALIALLKRHLALLITSSILIIVVLLIMGLMGGCSISCNSADKDDLPSGYLVLEYCETGNPSERAVIRYHNIEDVTAEEISSGYLPYENGYIDLILPEYTPDGYSVVTISSDTFSNNSSIKSLTVPASVTQIHRAAFSNCNSLKSVYLHGVEFVDMYAFYNCSNLEVITLPSTLQVISDCAFQSCYSLKTVIYEGSEESWNQITIGEDNDMLYNVDIEFLG